MLAEKITSIHLATASHYCLTFWDETKKNMKNKANTTKTIIAVASCEAGAGYNNENVQRLTAYS